MVIMAYTSKQYFILKFEEQYARRRGTHQIWVDACGITDLMCSGENLGIDIVFFKKLN